MGKLTVSKQDYLETILDHSSRGESVRSVDIAQAFGYSRASVSRAIKQLREDGFLQQEPYGRITLTEAGLREARLVRQRHDLLKYYLVAILGVDEETAEQDACRMEHVVSQATLRRREEYSARTLAGARTGTIKDKE